MRILLFRKVLTVEGGAERFMLEVIDHLAKAGADTRGVTLNGKPGEEFFDGRYAHLDVTRFSTRPYPGGLLGKMLRSLWAVFKLRRLIRKFDPQFICGQNTADAEVLFFATLGTKYRYSFFMPSTMFRFPDERLKYTRRFLPAFREAWNIIPGHKAFVPEKAPAQGALRRLVNEARAVMQYRAVGRAEHLLCLTRQMGTESKVLYGRDYTIIKAGLSNELFDHVKKHDIRRKLGLEGKTIVLNINRLDPRKRIDLAMRAFKELLAEFPDAYFVIGGRGPAKDNLEKLAAELGIAERVRMIGFVAEDELYDHFLAADVFIHLDWADFDLAVLEGLALGRKVVTSSELEAEGPLGRLEGTRLFRAYPAAEDVHKTLVTALRSKAEPEIPAREALRDYTWESYARNLLQLISPGARAFSSRAAAREEKADQSSSDGK